MEKYQVCLTFDKLGNRYNPPLVYSEHDLFMDAFRDLETLNPRGYIRHWELEFHKEIGWIDCL